VRGWLCTLFLLCVTSDRGVFFRAVGGYVVIPAEQTEQPPHGHSRHPHIYIHTHTLIYPPPPPQKPETKDQTKQQATIHIHTHIYYTFTPTMYTTHHTPKNRQRHAKEVFEKDMLSVKSDILAKLNVETQRVERQIVEMEKTLTDRVGVVCFACVVSERDGCRNRCAVATAWGSMAYTSSVESRNTHTHTHTHTHTQHTHNTHTRNPLPPPTPHTHTLNKHTHARTHTASDAAGANGAAGQRPAERDCSGIVL
jgi:hypothetical protein